MGKQNSGKKSKRRGGDRVARSERGTLFPRIPTISLKKELLDTVLCFQIIDEDNKEYLIISFRLYSQEF